MKNRNSMIIFFSLLLAICILAENVDALTIETVDLREKSKPIAINGDISTYRGVTTSGECKAKITDAGNAEYTITHNPKHGEITLYENGTFTYTHDGSKSRKDKFCFTVSVGNFVSNEATVNVKISKQKDKNTYADMIGKNGEYCAMFLKETGAFTGEKYGDELIFSPEVCVTKSQFYEMCSAVTGQDLTLYSDHPEEMITYGKAAEIIDRILSVTKVEPAFSQKDVDYDEICAVSNLCACGAISCPEIASLSKTLNRLDAAKLLVGAAGIIENRQ